MFDSGFDAFVLWSVIQFFDTHILYVYYRYYLAFNMYIMQIIA